MRATIHRACFGRKVQTYRMEGRVVRLGTMSSPREVVEVAVVPNKPACSEELPLLVQCDERAVAEAVVQQRSGPLVEALLHKLLNVTDQTYWRILAEKISKVKAMLASLPAASALKVPPVLPAVVASAATTASDGVSREAAASREPGGGPTGDSEGGGADGGEFE